ncbi:hypothetical protein HPB50_021371 [Hyalomma asiaticum]|uniref:Uncharacterized protein n=1 Tax=Hyalomma asiaticum TaxID=266040 RepID=A0ACB7T323_HYAAI|nr:hypothetical protein HPB50_021371 [Hyalomma asiaticum]
MHRRQSQGMVIRPPTLRETAEPPLPEVDENLELHPSRFEVFRWRLNEFLNQGHMMLLVLRTHVHDFNPHYAAEFEHAVLYYSMIKASHILFFCRHNYTWSQRRSTQSCLERMLRRGSLKGK